MGKYKPGAGAPTPGTRVDGVVWGAGKAAGTLRPWVYPLARPSARFSQINGVVQALDQLWLTLTASEVAQWETFAADVSVQGMDECWPRDWAGSWELLAREAFRQVNANRYIDGQQISTAPPLDGFTASEVTISIQTASALYWLAVTSAPPIGQISARLSLYLGWANLGEVAPTSARGLRFMGSLVATENGDVDITSQVYAMSGPGGGKPIKFAAFLREEGNMSHGRGFGMLP